MKYQSRNPLKLSKFPNDYIILIKRDFTHGTNAVN
jgi:hypothetical protein